MALQTSATFIIGFLELISIENELSAQVIGIIRNVRNDRYFQTLLYISHEEKEDNEAKNPFNAEVLSKMLAQQLELPIMHLKGQTTFYLWPNHNRRIFAIVPLTGEATKDKQLLLSLWKTLRRNVKTSLLLLARDEDNDEYLEEIVKFCTEHKAVNVVAVKESLAITKEFYSPQLFPEFHLNKHFMVDNEKTLFYPDKVHNMHRSPLRLAMQSKSTKAYILYKIGNDTALGGYVGHFFTEFSRKHNAILTFPYYGSQLDKMYTINFDHLVENGSYDMSTAPSYNLFTNDLVYSEIYDYMDWCLMVPVEKPLPTYKFYVVIYDSITLTLVVVALVLFSLAIEFTFYLRGQSIAIRNLIFNIYVINGLLGQSYKMEPSFAGIRSFLYMLICISGIIFNTSYVTYLQSYYTQPPIEKSIKTLDDIKKSGIRIAIYQQEFAVLNSYGASDDVKPLAKLIATYWEYNELRGSYNTKYVYPVPSAQWSIYENQQKFFKKPRFRLSEVCLVKMVGLTIPLQANSIYEEALNRAIGQSNEGGLITHWRTMSFLEAVRRKQISLVDRSAVVTFEPMKLDDMRIVVLMYVMMLLLICLCFIFEIYWPHRGFCVKKLLRQLRSL